jgi:hypothetical protein
MHIQFVVNSKSEYRNTKQIQISNAQIIEDSSQQATGNTLAISVQT